MATKKAKPDGQFFLSPENVEEYMANIPIEELPGVGYSTSYTLEQLKLKTCGDLQQISLAKLQQEVGKKFGETLYQFCRGIDNRPLVYGQIRKSISAEVNYGIRFTEYAELEKFLQQLCAEVHSRLTGIKRRGKCITLKLMVRAKEAPVETSKFMGHGYCDNLTKSTTLSDYTCDLDVITRTILTTMKSLNIPPKELRGIGIHIGKLDNPDECKVKKENVLKTMFEKVAEKRKESSIVEMQNLESTKNEVKSPIKSIPEKRKTSPNTPEKKSSKIIKKGRGKSKTAKTMDVSNMLQNATKREVQEQLPPDIDYNVLAELPEDIREEVLREHRQYTKTNTLPKQTTTSVQSNQKTLANVEDEFLQALPPELRLEIERDMNLHRKNVVAESKTAESSNKCETESKPAESENIFDQKNCRQLIESWLESSDSPEDCDVDIFAQNAQELIQTRRITDLLVPLRLLHRIISGKESCVWHAAYKTILNVVQREMIATYGSKMMLEEEINCSKCA